MEILIKLKELSKENEVWKNFPNCSNYFISNLGRVYYRNCKFPNWKLREEKMIVGKIDFCNIKKKMNMQFYGKIFVIVSMIHGWKKGMLF